MKKILVLDDQKEILNLWAEHFRMWGLEVEIHTGLNGLEGLKQIEAHKKFDLIITDYNMPEMNGLEFVRKVRQFDTKTPVCFFTGYLPELTFLADLMDNVILFEKPKITQKFKLFIHACLQNELTPIESI